MVQASAFTWWALAGPWGSCLCMVVKTLPFPRFHEGEFGKNQLQLQENNCKMMVLPLCRVIYWYLNKSSQREVFPGSVPSCACKVSNVVLLPSQETSWPPSCVPGQSLVLAVLNTPRGSSSSITHRVSLLPKPPAANGAGCALAFPLAAGPQLLRLHHVYSRIWIWTAHTPLFPQGIKKPATDCNMCYGGLDGNEGTVKHKCSKKCPSLAPKVTGNEAGRVIERIMAPFHGYIDIHSVVF